MKKKILILLVVVVGLLAVIGILVLKSTKPRTSGPCRGNCNILLIVADALRKDMLGCYGGPAHTPNIDALAQRGLLLENAYSTAPCTIPSSVSMFTGNYSRAYVVVTEEKQKQPLNRYSFYVNDKEKLLAEALKEKGFAVRMDVENWLAARTNNLQGFEKFKKNQQMSKEEIAFVENTLDMKEIDRTPYPRFALRHDPSYALLHYLLTIPPQQKFFLLKWFMDPHDPYNPEEKFKKKIPLDPEKLPRKENFYTTSRAITFVKLHKEKKLTPEESSYIKALYKAEVESLDERVGYIIKALKLRGLLEQTLIVFTADHGELLGERGWYGHEFGFYQPLVQVPLIFSGPGIPVGKREKALVSHLDLMPTLKEWSGLAYPDNMRGKSYSSLLNGGTIPERTLYFDRVANVLTTDAENDALLNQDYKLIISKKKDRFVFELFNLKDDPGERKNIAAETPQTRKEMFKKILEIRKENNLRLKENYEKIGKDVKLDKVWEKTMEHLKSLGYLQ